MPSASEHRAKYERNRTFLDTGLAATNPEWAAVVAFYAAVHLIERLAAADPRGPVHNRNHVDRGQYLNRHLRHRVISNHYAVLQRASEISRYGTVNQFNALYSAATVQSELIDTHLAAIETYVAAYFAPPAAPPAPPTPPPAPPAPSAPPPTASGS